MSQVLDSSRARTREREVDRGDRNKEGPLVFTQQVNLYLYMAHCPAGSNKYLETLAWRHLFDGMLLDMGHHSRLL